VAGTVSLHWGLSLGWFAAWLVSINGVALVFFGVDKLLSLAGGKWLRIPEIVLLGTGLLGGCVGGFAGMALFHHKVEKRSFRLAFATIVVVEIGFICYWYFAIR